MIETCDFRDAIEGFSQWGEIPVIYLLPEKYGIGLGSELMRFALSALAERGREQVGIWVLEKNIRAIVFYQKHGFLRSAHTKIHKPTGLVELLFLKSKEAICHSAGRPRAISVQYGFTKSMDGVTPDRIHAIHRCIFIVWSFRPKSPSLKRRVILPIFYGRYS